jgi:hypothetical protein
MLIHKTGKIYIYMHDVRNLRNEVIHTYIQMSILSGCKKEICICIKIRSLVIYKENVF